MARILSLHPALDGHPLWQSRTTRVTARDPGFYDRPGWRRLAALAEIAAEYDVCVFSSQLDKRFLLAATHLLRRLRGVLTVQAESYLAFAAPGSAGPRERWRIRKHRLLFAATDLVTVQSSFEPGLYARFCGSSPCCRYVPWYHDGVVRPVSVQAWERRWREGDVLCPGRHRDVALFAEAVRGLGRRCVVILRQADREACRPFHLPPEVEVLADLPREEYRARFDRAAAVVLPFSPERCLRSLGHIAYFAAALRQVPVLTSRTPHLRDYADEGAEVLCHRPGDARDLRRQLEELLGDRALARRLARSARRRSLGEFSQSRHVLCLLHEIETLTASAGR